MDWKWLDWSEESVQNWATIRNMCNVFAAKSVYFTRAVSVLRQNHPVRAEHHLADTNHRISVYTEKMTSFDRDRRETRARAPRHSAAGSLFWLPFEGHFDFDFIVFFTDHLFETVDQPWRSNTRSNEILVTHSLTDTIHDMCSDVIHNIDQQMNVRQIYMRKKWETEYVFRKRYKTKSMKLNCANDNYIWSKFWDK